MTVDIGLTREQRQHLDDAVRGSIRDANALRAIVGARFLAARELNGFSQSRAAALLRYESGTQLALIERGQRLPPLWLIVSAAALYAVPVDYLVGTSPDPEPDRRAAEKHAMLRHVDALVRGGVEALVSAAAQSVAFLAAPAADHEQAQLEAAALAALSAFEAVRAENRELYEHELRGGARLDAAMAELRQILGGQATVARLR